MNKEQLYKLLEKDRVPTPSDIDRLRELVEKHPYFEVAKFLYLKALYLHDITSFKDELDIQSVLISSREALFYYIFKDDYAKYFKKTGKDKFKEDRTNLLLDAFFENVEPESTALEYESPTSSLAAVDYLSYLEEETNKTEHPKVSFDRGALEDLIYIEDKSEEIKTPSLEEETFLEEDDLDDIGISDYIDSEILDQPDIELMPLKHQNLIDNFIEKTKDKEFTLLIDKEDLKDDRDYLHEEESTNESELGEDMFFTETLSKIYTKQGRFEKAYEIIEHLSLKYPKKNSYFADQLSYLEKLIINSKFKNKK